MELFFLSEEEKLVGFKVHFSNGSRAKYMRVKGQADAVNVMFEQNGSINYMIGDLEALEKVWKINGVPVTDWDAVNRSED